MNIVGRNTLSHVDYAFCADLPAWKPLNSCFIFIYIRGLKLDILLHSSSEGGFAESDSNMLSTLDAIEFYRSPVLDRCCSVNKYKKIIS